MTGFSFESRHCFKLHRNSLWCTATFMQGLLCRSEVSPNLRQSITWTNNDLLSIGPSWTNGHFMKALICYCLGVIIVHYVSSFSNLAECIIGSNPSGHVKYRLVICRKNKATHLSCAHKSSTASQSMGYTNLYQTTTKQNIVLSVYIFI